MWNQEKTERECLLAESTGSKSAKPEARESDQKSSDAKDADTSESSPAADGKTLK